MNEKQNPLREKSFHFAISIVKIYKFLSEQKREFILSKQLLRSGTSIGANVREAQNAQSTPDFIHKLSISQKEYDETLYWLELLHQTEYLDEIEFSVLFKDANEILKLLRSSIITSKRNSS
jgi:four helix bundle protein